MENTGFVGSILSSYSGWVFFYAWATHSVIVLSRT